MTTLTVTAKGQITLRRSVLDHLGVSQGGRVEVELLPHGEARLVAANRGQLDGFFGKLHRDGQPAVSLEDMNQAIEDGWAGL
jgi:bifunctional DNA-binding transcriptional regulator/antitoxin component of YhaV-PrlF toxin-antitoxin module